MNLNWRKSTDDWSLFLFVSWFTLPCFAFLVFMILFILPFLPFFILFIILKVQCSVGHMFLNPSSPNPGWREKNILKSVSHLPEKKTIWFCFSESLSKIMKNAFYFTLKALFVLKIFKLLSWLFVHVEKTALLKR